MDWVFIKREMSNCVERVDAIHKLQGEIERMAKEVQILLNNPQDTLASDIYKAIYPVFDQKIRAIQDATILKLSKER